MLSKVWRTKVLLSLATDHIPLQCLQVTILELPKSRHSEKALHSSHFREPRERLSSNLSLFCFRG